MELAPFIVPLSRFSPVEAAWDGPLAFVDFSNETGVSDEMRLPMVPLIGIGNDAHPLAATVDAVVDGKDAALALARRVLRNPLAAAALVQLLRVSEGMALGPALSLESMAYAMLQGSREHLDWRAARALKIGGAAGLVQVTRVGSTLAITLDRPDAGNAIDRTMRDGLAEALALANLDATIARVTLDAKGKAFSLGADLEEFGTTTDPATAHAIRMLTLPAREAVGCADRMAVHVDGACIGAGLELAAFAGRITATRRSWFQLPELDMGIIPGAGGCVSVPRRIGRRRTALMVLSGRRIGSAQALDWGLIDAVVDDPAGDDGGNDVA
jgi:enoyl-CoA hydratase/carnithine racemase